MVIVAGHRWRFHSATGKIIATRQGTANTGSRIMAAIITIGVPMTVDTSIRAIATMGVGTVIDVTGNGDPMNGGITMTSGATTVDTAAAPTSERRSAR